METQADRVRDNLVIAIKEAIRLAKEVPSESGFDDYQNHYQEKLVLSILELKAILDKIEP